MSLLHHRDPFDRILIAQAIYEHLTIITLLPAIASLMFMRSMLLNVDNGAIALNRNDTNYLKKLHLASLLDFGYYCSLANHAP